MPVAGSCGAMRPGTEACALRKRLDCFASFEDLPSLRVARCFVCRVTYEGGGWVSRGRRAWILFYPHFLRFEGFGSRAISERRATKAPGTHHRGGPLHLFVLDGGLELREVEASRENTQALSAACARGGRSTGADDVRDCGMCERWKP
jgi:hypothetical protein